LNSDTALAARTRQPTSYLECNSKYSHNHIPTPIRYCDMLRYYFEFVKHLSDGAVILFVHISRSVDEKTLDLDVVVDVWESVYPSSSSCGGRYVTVQPASELTHRDAGDHIVYILIY